MVTTFQRTIEAPPAKPLQEFNPNITTKKAIWDKKEYNITLVLKIIAFRDVD
jgi:hypothetical protein